MLDDGGDAGLAAFERALASVEAEPALAVLGIRPVAVKAIFGEDGLNLAGEIDRGGGGRSGSRAERSDQ